MDNLKFYILFPIVVLILLGLFLHIFLTFGDQILDMIKYIFNPVFDIVNRMMSISQHFQP